jgi:hypothetical protein
LLRANGYIRRLAEVCEVQLGLSGPAFNILDTS